MIVRSQVQRQGREKERYMSGFRPYGGRYGISTMLRGGANNVCRLAPSKEVTINLLSPEGGWMRVVASLKYIGCIGRR